MSISSHEICFVAQVKRIGRTLRSRPTSVAQLETSTEQLARSEARADTQHRTNDSLGRHRKLLRAGGSGLRAARGTSAGRAAGHEETHDRLDSWDCNTCRQATIHPACFAQVAAGYVLHKGVAQGVLHVGDSVTSRCVFRCHDHDDPDCSPLLKAHAVKRTCGDAHAAMPLPQPCRSWCTAKATETYSESCHSAARTR